MPANEFPKTENLYDKNKVTEHDIVMAEELAKIKTFKIVIDTRVSFPFNS